MSACVKQRNVTCQFYHPVSLAVILLLAATLALLSAFEVEGAAPSSTAAIVGAQAAEGAGLPGESATTTRCPGCYHVVRQTAETPSEGRPLEGQH